MRRSRAEGVTFIEIMVAILVLAIALTLALPSFIGQGDRKQLIAAAERVRSELQYARSEAIKKNQEITVQLVVGAGADRTWCLGLDQAAPGATDCNCDTAAANCTVDGQTHVLNNGKPAGSQKPFGTTQVTNNLGGTTLGFEPVRGASSRTGDLTLTSSAGETVEVAVNASGRVTICSNSLSPFSSCP